MTRQVIVVGGGIAGLATAWLLRERARGRGQPIALRVLEASAQSGGFTRTDEVDGFVCEWGPNGFLSSTGGRTLQLVRELDMEHRLISADPAAARRFIYHSGKLHEVPTKPGAFLRSGIVPAATKLRMLAEPLVRARRNHHDESVEHFGRRRLGAGFARYLLDPMVSGVFAGDPSTLSLPAAFPKMAELEREHGGLFRAMLARKRNGGASGGPAGPGGTLHSFRRGMGELTHTLARELGDALHTAAPVERVTTGPDGFTVSAGGTNLHAHTVVLACPAHAACRIVQDLDGDVAAALGDIPFASVSVDCEAFGAEDLERPLDGFGVLIPRTEGMRSLGILCSDRIFPQHAPGGARMLRTLVGGARDPGAAELSEERLRHVVQQDLRTLFGVRGKPRMHRVYAHRQAIAQYTLGHLDRVAKIDALSQRVPGLHFTGASYRGVSINGCVDDAYRIAEAAMP